MKSLIRFKSIFQGIKNSTKRFPIPIGISLVLAGVLIYINEEYSSLSKTTQDNLNHFAMILGMAILMSLCIDLFMENYFHKDNIKKLISYALGALVLFFYHRFYLRDFELVTISRFTGIMIFFGILFYYIPVILNKDENYEYRIIHIIGNFIETSIYSLVLLLGTFIIIFTIDNLFDMNINYKIYMNIFYIIFIVFALAYFLSKLPPSGVGYPKRDYTKSLKVLLTYIVIPLISIYTVILYVYFFKILITREWPKGLVSHLVVWYSAVSIGVIFLITPLLEEDKISKYFKNIFPKAILPILVMMFISIGQRISQYGITENRYYTVVLGMWITVIMIYFSVKKPLKNIFIPVSLSIVVLNSVIGPLNSFAISNYSQNRRLDDILNRNNMIQDNSIVKNINISEEDKREISNILYYFDRKESLKNIKILKDDFTTANTEDIFGFKYEPNIYGYPIGDDYFYYGINIFDSPINIKDYEYYIQMSSWNEKTIVLDDIEIKKGMDDFFFEILRDNIVLTKIDTREIAKEIVKKLPQGMDMGKNQLSPDEMSYEIEIENLKVKLIFTNLSGVKDGDNLDFKGIEYIILIGNQ